MAVAGFLGFVALSMTGLFFYLRSAAPSIFQITAEHRFPEPTLQKAPQEDLREYEFEQRSALSGYAWVDRPQGVARIPIEEAMRIVAGKGEHAYDPLDQPASPPSNPGAPDGVRP